MYLFDFEVAHHTMKKFELSLPLLETGFYLSGQNFMKKHGTGRNISSNNSLLQ